MIRHAETALCLLLALGVFASPASAKATTSFDPVISVEERFEDNVQFIATEDAAQSDWSTRIGAVLPWGWQWKKTSASLNYSPMFVRYSEFSTLDHMANRLNFNTNTRFSPRSSLAFRTSARRIQAQGFAGSVEDPDLDLNQRTTRNLGRADLNYERAMSQRWDWELGGGASVAIYEEIEERQPGDPPPSTENRAEFRVSTAMVREMSRKARFGARYLYSRYDLEYSGTEDIHAVALTASYDVGRRVALSIDLGGFYRTDFGDGDIESEKTSSSDFLGRLQFERTYRRTELTIYARYAPSSGGSRIGTSTNSVAGIQLSSHDTQTWNWSGAVRYSYRDPTNPLVAAVNTGSVGGYLERALGRKLGLRLRSNLVSQENIYFNAGLMLTWYPKARSARGGLIP